MGKEIKPLIVPVFVPHSGCPHRCVFCNQSLLTGLSEASLEPMAIRRQISTFLSGCRPAPRASQIAFYGGNFLGLPPGKITMLLSEAARFVAEKRIGSIRFSTRPDTIDADSLALLSGYPVQTVEIGVQSMDDRVLALAERGHTADDTRHAAVLVKEKGFQLGLQIMVGLPGDDEAASMETAHSVGALSPDFVRIYPAVVVTGSRMALWYKNGEFTPWSLERTVSLVKRMVLFFRKKKIDVIRMGLQATEDLQPGETILAGPYHPAFGHLVLSRIMLDRAISVLQSRPGINGASEVTLRVHPRVESRLRGLRNENIQELKERFQLKGVRVRTDSLVPEESVLISEVKPAAPSIPGGI